jgi:transcriptional regulator GlxA family with amidase domain
MTDYRIAIPIYTGVDLIDVAAPVDVLSRVTQFWKGGSIDIELVAETTAAIVTGQKISLMPTETFASFRAQPANVLLVPGAYDVTPAREDQCFMDFLRTQGGQATWVTSVCTGALLLGYAGLLEGYRATTHWAALAQLQQIAGIEVVNGFPRWVHDRNRFTGGGVSSSLDAALMLVSILTGSDDVAKSVQLLIQYHPSPPFNCGDPAVADYDTYKSVAG